MSKESMITRLMSICLLITAIGLISTQAYAQALWSDDARVVGYAGVGPPGQIPETRRAFAHSRLPMLSSLSQVPGMSDVAPQGYGSLGHPFTTKAAYVLSWRGTPTDLAPYRATGKLWMRFGTSWGVCTASIIEKGLLVTAAHCTSNFGGTFADEIYFEPARHGTIPPYDLRWGTWRAVSWWVSSSYLNGTDTCDVPGIVCNNDVSIVVLSPSEDGRHIAEALRARYHLYVNNEGFVSFLGQMATQVTQLGYPVAMDDGYKMIRTDSLGYQVPPNNIIIGSNQTGGSSGGPWILNYGRNPRSTTREPSMNDVNRVVATTSWGYVSAELKVQGASRFANNAEFPAPGPTNVEALINAACDSSPENCF